MVSQKLLGKVLHWSFSTKNRIPTLNISVDIASRIDGQIDRRTDGTNDHKMTPAYLIQRCSGYG